MNVLPPLNSFLVLLLGLSICLSPPSSFAKSNKRTLKLIDNQIQNYIQSNYAEILKNERELKIYIQKGKTDESKLKPLVKNQEELTIKQQFYYSLNSKIQLHYKRGSLMSFIDQTLTSIGEQEVLSGSPNYNYIEFLTHLRKILPSGPTSSTNLIAYIEGYIRTSGILNSTPPSKFLADRNYANGFIAESSYTISKTKLGDSIDLELKDIDRIEDQIVLAKKRVNESRIRLPEK